MAEGGEEKKGKSSLANLYPHISSQKISELMEIGASSQQLERADMKGKETLDKQMLQNRHSSQRLTVMVIGTSGSGKSATANILLGENEFEVGCSAQPITKDFMSKTNSLGLTVVDTPGSWNMPTQLPVKYGPVDFYIIVINIACPRFEKGDLQNLRALQSTDHKGILSSGRCMAVLTHADTTLRDVSLDGYLTEIQGDPLYEFLRNDMKDRIMAVNNNACTKYEKEETQKGLVLGIAHAMGVALVQKDAEKKTATGRLTAIREKMKRFSIGLTVPQSIRRFLESLSIEDGQTQRSASTPPTEVHYRPDTPIQLPK